MMTYEDTLQYLYASQPAFHVVGAAAYKPGLGNTISLMDALGNPHKTFRSVHVAGTNGKGSTSHMLAAVLQSAGYKTGLYTSPHLVDYRERIRINGRMIPKHEVVGFVEDNKQLLEQVKPSFFETTMAMAFSWFMKENVDIAVIEVGLGGRLDSTNIIMPEVSVITNIGLDHTEFLGNTLAEIASEKAGIIKRGVPVVIGESCDETRLVFQKRAEEAASELVFAELSDLPVSFAGICQLRGMYQQKNIKTVLATLNVLRRRSWHISDEAIETGLAAVCTLTGLEGRWQTIKYEACGKPLTIILDTGHNSHGVSSYIDDLRKISGLRIVFGMVSDKDVSAVLSLLPSDAVYYFTQADSHRAIPASQFRQMANEAGLHGRAFTSVIEAVEQAIYEAAADDTVFIGGSNYVVGEALQLLHTTS